jgi:hypothetical protein
MEPLTTSHPLDIRTLLLLLVEHEMPRDKVLGLIATQCGIPTDKLIEAFTVRTLTAVPSSKTYIRWDSQRIENLVSRWNQGERPSSIAKNLGCSTSVVYSKISMLRKTRSDINRRESHNPKFNSGEFNIAKATA